MTVYLSELAEYKLNSLYEYLIENFSLELGNEFILALTKKIDYISKNPKNLPESFVMKGVFKCDVSQHSSFYYRILENVNEIEIITLIDKR